jgi:superfamily I DNA and RNA helicase
MLCAPSLPAQAVKIQQYVTRLITAENLQPGDIVVLVANGERRRECCELLTSLPIPRNAKWHEQRPLGSTGLLIDTVARFKGLEAPATILWGFDNLTREQHLELLYVGTSRAKSLLCLAGNSESCDKLLTTHAEM